MNFEFKWLQVQKHSNWLATCHTGARDWHYPRAFDWPLNLQLSHWCMHLTHWQREHWILQTSLHWCNHSPQHSLDTSLWQYFAEAAWTLSLLGREIPTLESIAQMPRPAHKIVFGIGAETIACQSHADPSWDPFRSNSFTNQAQEKMQGVKLRTIGPHMSFSDTKQLSRDSDIWWQKAIGNHDAKVSY